METRSHVNLKSHTHVQSVWKLASQRSMRAAKAQKASASSRITYSSGAARSLMPCSIMSNSKHVARKRCTKATLVQQSQSLLVRPAERRTLIKPVKQAYFLRHMCKHSDAGNMVQVCLPASS